MGRSPMQLERRQKIVNLAKQMSHAEVAKILGVSRESVSRIVRQKFGVKKPHEKSLSDLRKAEAKITPEGCFNVFDRSYWLL